MKSIATKNFNSHLNLEYSSSPTLVPLGQAKCSMELYMSDDGNRGFIEWVYELNEDDGEDVVDIGLWFEEGTKTLKDYDGVFSMPKQAIELLEENGFDCEYAK
jgi:hypothetical protein